MNNYEQWSCKEREKEKYLLGSNDMRRWYQRDIDQITHSTGFRKLQQKSQLLSENDSRCRSRLIHTIEVVRIATEISERLGVSKELTEAICFAHDIATAPYGNIGNKFLSRKSNSKFSHEFAGAMQLLNLSKKKVTDDDNLLAEMIRELEETDAVLPMKTVNNAPFKLYISKEDNQNGTFDYYEHHISPEIIDGVMNHGENGKPNTLEGQIVRIADNIAYLSQDVEDLLVTGIISIDKYVKYKAAPLEYQTRKVSYRFEWEEIDNDANRLGGLRDVFDRTRGKRVSSLINRYVDYNINLLNDGKLEYYKSDILDKEIPLLKVDEGMQHVIDFTWYFIETHYKNVLIRTSNVLQLKKIDVLWNIINDSQFKKNNTSYKKFMNGVEASSLFSGYSSNWKQAYFISHLTYREVDIIIESFHERNFTFEIDLIEA